MRDAKWVSYFRHVVLATMALPACGGAVEPSMAQGDADDGSTGPFQTTTRRDSSTTTPSSGPVADDSGVTVQDSALIDESAPSAHDSAWIPRVSCSLDPPSGGPCVWVRSFTGDPLTCVGFSGAGTSQQCSTLCQMSIASQTADRCEAHLLSEGGIYGSVSCTSTTGICSDASTPPPCCCCNNGGRRPAYFASLGFGAPFPGRELGTHFARAACMEAGSIEAFRWLRDELLAHGAPKRLVVRRRERSATRNAMSGRRRRWRVDSARSPSGLPRRHRA
jgi:hypothetical protein